MKSCTCGSQKFEVYEELVNEGDLVHEEKTLLISSGETLGITKIVCAECRKEYDMGDFENIEFV